MLCFLPSPSPVPYRFRAFPNVSVTLMLTRARVDLFSASDVGGAVPRASEGQGDEPHVPRVRRYGRRTARSLHRVPSA